MTKAHAHAVVLTAEDLEELVERAVRRALAKTKPESDEVTEEDLAKSRKTLRRLGRGS